MNKDIFISYRNDGEGNNFAARLFEALDAKEYSVYFNSNEQHSGSFPDRLKNAIENCMDFILIVSAGCLEGLRQERESDWVRSEILYAKEKNKNITPVYIGKTVVPERWEDYPEDIRFLFARQSVYLPEQFAMAPISDLLSKFISKPSKEEYKDVANGNEAYDLHLDFMETLQKAESGDAEAMFEIGCMYYHGFATADGCDGKTDYAEAAKWFKCAIDNNSTIESYIDTLLGNLYYWGQMPYEEQSFSSSMSYFAQAAEGSVSSKSMDKVIYMKIEGFEQEFDYDATVKMFDSIKNECSDLAKSHIAAFYINYGRFKDAIEVLESVKTPDAGTEYQLGMLYQRGVQCWPPKPDMYRAVDHFRRAAENGHSDAIHALSTIYFRGTNGYRKDIKKSREYHKLAAEKGGDNACYGYAWMCKYGLGGSRNVEEAIKYFELAAKMGHVASMVELGQLYQEPECKNYQKAFEWAKKGAESGSPLGNFVLGNLYFFGRGCEADMNKAMRNYKKALEQGVYQAGFMMKKIEEIA